MADVDVSGIFKHEQTASTDGDSAPLARLLAMAAGAGIDPDDALNQRLKQGSISVISVFQPNPCTLEPAATGGTSGATPVPGDEGSGQGGGSTQEVSLQPGPRIALPLREKLLALGSTFNELVALLDQPGLPAADGTGKAGTQAQAGRCWHYRNTTHGPTGLIRANDLLKVKVSGFIETLGGLTKLNAETEYIMYMEYTVNTYLAGEAAWEPDPATQLPRPRPPVVLNATNGCYGTGGKVAGLKSCGSDTVSDVLRIMVNFKRVFICDASVSGSNISGSAGLQASVAKLQEQTFAGVMAFTHSMDPRPPRP